ncbi:MAG: hypothetical protein KTR13_09645 [Saprospiraceae bacterium]|nr:hypothetical protein [Saprospiraceae bacterium]
MKYLLCVFFLAITSLATGQIDTLYYNTNEGCKYYFLIDRSTPFAEDFLEECEDCIESWSGDCLDGFLQGNGTLTIIDGKYSTKITGLVDRGEFKGELYIDGTFKKDRISARLDLQNIMLKKTSDIDVKYNRKKRNFELKGTLYEGGQKIDAQKITLDKDMTYKGMLINGVPEGAGEMTCLCGKSFTGTFKDGLLIKGLVEYADGAIDYGTFNEKGLHGLGYTKYADGDEFFGEWKNDKPSGLGVMVWGPDDIESGIYKNWKLQEEIDLESVLTQLQQSYPNAYLKFCPSFLDCPNPIQR